MGWEALGLKRVAKLVTEGRRGLLTTTGPGGRLYTDDLWGGSAARGAGLKSWTAHNAFGLGPSGDPDRVRPSSFGSRSGASFLHGSSCAEGGQARNTVAPV